MIDPVANLDVEVLRTIAITSLAIAVGLLFTRPLDDIFRVSYRERTILATSISLMIFYQWKNTQLYEEAISGMGLLLAVGIPFLLCFRVFSEIVSEDS